MILNIDDAQQVTDPTEAQVQQLLTSVAADQFAVMSQGDQRYIQVYHNDDGTFTLEYRDGSPEAHFAAEDDAISVSQVVATFIGYLRGDPQQWQPLHQWQRVEFDEDFQGHDFHTHYILNDTQYSRIVVGRETNVITAQPEACLECQAKPGDFHDEGCSREQCPCCHGRIESCDCC